MLFSEGPVVIHLSAFKQAVLCYLKKTSFTQKTLYNRKAEEVLVADWKAWLFMLTVSKIPIF